MVIKEERMYFNPYTVSQGMCCLNEKLFFICSHSLNFKMYLEVNHHTRLAALNFQVFTLETATLEMYQIILMLLYETLSVCVGVIQLRKVL